MSIKKVVIPLDGSKLSEEALLTLPLLQALGIDEIHLVTVCEDLPEGAPDSEYQEFLQKGEAAGGAYLRAKAEHITAGDITAHYCVRFGLAAEEIVREAEACGADFIVIATHGRYGPDRWSLGSVADTVVRLSRAPVLVIGPNTHVSIDGVRPKRIMVPLDGSSVAELALAPAKLIAQHIGANVHLVRVVTLPDRWVTPFSSVAPLADMETLQRSAETYLSKISGAGVTTRAVLKAGYASNVADELIRYVSGSRVDLVVMTSHTRVGVSRLLLGGVADELMRGSAPVLVIKPGENQTSSLFDPAAEAAAQAGA